MRRQTASHFLRLTMQQHRTQLRGLESLRILIRPLIAPSGQAWGTLVHGLLEHAMRHKHTTADDLRRLGVWLTVEEPQLRDVLDSAVNTVIHVARAGFWQEANRSYSSVETPFTFVESSDAMLTGVIDLLLGQEGHWRIIDYKTDVGSIDHEALYQGQLKMYERALASVGITGISSAIQSVR